MPNDLILHRDVQDRQLWRDKTCPAQFLAHHDLEIEFVSIISIVFIIVIIITIIITIIMNIVVIIVILMIIYYCYYCYSLFSLLPLLLLHCAPGSVQVMDFSSPSLISWTRVHSRLPGVRTAPRPPPSSTL